MSDEQLEKAIQLGAFEMLRKQTAEMKVILLEEKYDALWKRYTNEKEQYEMTIAHLNRMLELEQKLCKAIKEREQLKDDKQKLLDEDNKMRDICLLSHFDSFRQMDNAGETGFTLIAKDLREALVAFETDSIAAGAKARNSVHCAFDGLFRIITERRTPSKQDVENVKTIREGLISNGIIDA